MKLFILWAFLIPTMTAAALNDLDKQEIFNKNLLKNGGFESGAAMWTSSAGSYAVVSSGSNLLFGLVSATWDAAASGNTLTSTAITIPNGMYGRSGTASCLILTPSGTATHTIEAYDGTNILSSVTITSSTAPSRNSVNFVFPSSGSISLRIQAHANEPLIAIDNCFLGPAEGYNLGTVSQASFIGSAYIAGTASCIPTRTSTSVGAFSTVAACPGPTIVSNPGPGTIQTTDADLPQFTVTGLPPGKYRVNIRGASEQTTSSGVRAGLTISDGTTTCVQSGMFNTSSQANPVNLECEFEYSSAGDRTFAVQGSSASVTLNLNVDDARHNLLFDIYRFPSSTDIVYRPDAVANSWSGYHDSTCSWARTNATYGDPTADATCTLVERTNRNFGTVTTYTVTNAEPGIVFTPSRAGRYYVCATAAISQGNAGVTEAVKLWDGTTTVAERDKDTTGAGTGAPITLCGIYNAASTSSVTLSLQTKASAGSITLQNNSASSTIEWSIFQIDQPFPAPLLANSVVSSSSGVTKIVSATISNSGTPTVSRQDGTWISSLTDNGNGDTTINIAASTFSATPSCSCTSITANANARGCQISTNTAASSTLVRIFTFATVTAVASDNDVNIICVGPQ